jgi:type III secretion protein J
MMRIDAGGNFGPSPKAKACSVAALAFAALLLSGCDVELYANLPEREANAMVAALNRHDIAASRVPQEDGQISVHVDEGEFAEAVQILEREGLPHRQFQSMGEIFKRVGLVVSPTQERAQMHYALSEELSQTISQIDGVVSARVHVVLPESDPLRGNAQPSSASVFIRHEPGLVVGPLIPRIKSLVAASVAQLDYGRVSVVAVAVPGRAYGGDAELVRFLGLSMTRPSAERAGWMLGILGLAAAGLGALLVRVRMKRDAAGPYKLTQVR